MKVENNGVSLYKSILDMQKQMVDMLIQKNLQGDQSQQNTNVDTQKQNVIEGKKVSIYV